MPDPTAPNVPTPPMRLHRLDCAAILRHAVDWLENDGPDQYDLAEARTLIEQVSERVASLYDEALEVTNPRRYAFVLAGHIGAPETARVVAEYLPSGYQVTGIGPAPEGDRFRRVHISGRDNAGWTLEDYVIPRLWSGGYRCTEVTAEGDAL